MSKPALKDATIVFEPNPDWDWEGWDGSMSVSPCAMPCKFSIGGKVVILKSDIEALGIELAGKMYKAKGFSDIPGTVTMGQLTVSNPSQLVTVAKQKLILDDTKGEFTVACVPSFKEVKTAVIPDPAPRHTGRWHLEDACEDWVESS